MKRKHAPFISHDTELIPTGIFHDEALLVQYDSRLSMLGDKTFPCVAEGFQFHADGISAEMAPVKPYLDPFAMFEELYRKKEYYEQILELSLVGMDWVDLNDIGGFSEKTAPFLWDSVRTFGCSPDFRFGGERCVPRRVRESTLREAGLHIHIDLRPEYRDQRTEDDIAMALPPTNAHSCAGIASELHEATAFLFTDSAPLPKELWYRMPETYRPTRYGIEYRSFGSEIVNRPDDLLTLFNIVHEWQREHFNTGVAA
jgi:hypothetical protein